MLRSTLPRLVPILLLVLAAGSCRTASSRLVLQERADAWPAFEASSALDPFAAPTWKECLPETYVFVEHVGDPRQFGDAMRRLFADVRAAGLPATGAPFGLFFDDPARVPLERQRSRACLPVAPGTTPPAGLRLGELATRMVVFQRRAGAYTEAPLLVPPIMAHLKERGWRPSGPVREVYLVDPGSVADTSELVCEVQVPWTTGG